MYFSQKNTSLCRYLLKKLFICGSHSVYVIKKIYSRQYEPGGEDIQGIWTWRRGYTKKTKKKPDICNIQGLNIILLFNHVQNIFLFLQQHNFLRRSHNNATIISRSSSLFLCPSAAQRLFFSQCFSHHHVSKIPPRTDRTNRGCFHKQDK